MMQRGYTPHVRSRGEEREEKRSRPGYSPRRWVVEACHSWFNRFRKILVRFEKTERSYLALVQLAWLLSPGERSPLFMDKPLVSCISLVVVCPGILLRRHAHHQPEEGRCEATSLRAGSQRLEWKAP
jgi:hypothetical protein